MNAVNHVEMDLQRANIRLAWAFCDRMTDAQFRQLCQVTAESLRHNEREPHHEREHAA